MNVKSSATITHLLSGLGIIVIIIIAGSSIVYTAYSKSQTRQDNDTEEVKVTAGKNTDSVNDMKLDINSIQKDIGFIQEDIKASKLIQQKILDKLEN